jgi:hypothetical protein
MSGEPTAAPGRWIRLCKLALKAVLTAVLLGVSWQGFQNVAQNMGSLDTWAQIAMTVAQAGYSLLALAAAACAWLAPRRAFGLVAAAGVLSVLAAGLIPLAWAPDILGDWPRFAGGAAAAALPVALGLGWATR